MDLQLFIMALCQMEFHNHPLEHMYLKTVASKIDVHRKSTYPAPVFQPDTLPNMLRRRWCITWFCHAPCLHSTVFKSLKPWDHYVTNCRNKGSNLEICMHKPVALFGMPNVLQWMACCIYPPSQQLARKFAFARMKKIRLYWHKEYHFRNGA